MSRDYLDRHETAGQPLLGCCQIVQSQKARRWTFRLDRCTGDVDQIVVDSEGDTGWQSMLVYSELDYPDANSPGSGFFLWVGRQTHLSPRYLDRHHLEP